MRLDSFILDNGAFALGRSAPDWKAAIKIGTDILVDLGCAEERYFQGILEAVERLGPYFVILPLTAMPHDRPESGALKTGFSLVTLQEPVDIGDDEESPADLLLTLCAADKKEMTESLIVQIMELFDCPEALAALRAGRTKEDVRAAFALVKEWGRSAP